MVKNLFVFLLNDSGAEVFSCLDCFFSDGDNGTEIFGGFLAAGEYFLKVSDRFSSQFGSYSVEVTTTTVPEPASMLGLLAIGAMGVGSTLQRKKKGMLRISTC
ncbi:MAG: PEP-CTERM sorting domain-containing protein [Spirulinaceae cyanobacterium]